MREEGGECRKEGGEGVRKKERSAGKRGGEGVRKNSDNREFSSFG